MRNKVFISHATPIDNDFTKWLYLKLTCLGYEVWCDVSGLPKGGDFWKNIETEIRTNTIKFLVVLSETSNKATGVLNELAVALKVKKQLQDDTFIIPLSIDNNLSYDDINIEIVRLNAIDFKSSWAEGLKDLVTALEKQNVPKDPPDENKSNSLYQKIFLQDRTQVDRDEYYVSNWFPIVEFPDELRFHRIGKLVPKDFDIRRLPYPAVNYKEYLCTFGSERAFTSQLPATTTYDSRETIRITTKSIFESTYQSDFITTGEAQRLIVQLTNKAFENRMKEKGVNPYEMSNHTGYWFKKDQLEKDKFEKVQLVGKQKEKNWHYGISASSKLYPFPVLTVASHIFFTSDGSSVIESKRIQHAARRRQGKNWWNDDWRTKMSAFVKYLSDDDTSFFLKGGEDEKIIISNTSMKFHSKVSYNIPEKNTLAEEAEISELYGIDELEEESENTEQLPS